MVRRKPTGKSGLTTPGPLKSPFKSPQKTESPGKRRTPRHRSAKDAGRETPAETSRSRSLRPRTTPAGAYRQRSLSQDDEDLGDDDFRPSDDDESLSAEPSPTKPLQGALRGLQLTTPTKPPKSRTRKLSVAEMDLTDPSESLTKSKSEPRKPRVRSGQCGAPSDEDSEPSTEEDDEENTPPKPAARGPRARLQSTPVASEPRKTRGRTPKPPPKTPRPNPSTPARRGGEEWAVGRAAGGVGGGGLEELSRQLHASVVPSELLCREEELEELVGVVGHALAQGRSQSLYVSGVPGTGKTASVLNAVRRLRESRDVPPFDFVQLNGMNLAEPSQFYPRLYAQLWPEEKGVSARKALERLDQRFLDGGGQRAGQRPLVLLVDELDQLRTRRQNVLYQIFEWATKDAARLVVLAVANTLDLPERLLTERVSSRLGMSRMCFQPYDFQQICAILEARLGMGRAEGGKAKKGPRKAGAGALVEADAVELLSRTVASRSGDLRTALHIAREAVAQALAAGEARLTTKRLQSVLGQLRKSVRSQWLSALPPHQKLFLEGMGREFQRTGHGELGLPAVAAAYAGLVAEARARPRSEREARLVGLGRAGLLRLVSSLVDAQILLPAPVPSLWHRPLRPNFNLNDITFHINDH